MNRTLGAATVIITLGAATVIIAMGAGKIAARGIHEYLMNLD